MLKQNIAIFLTSVLCGNLYGAAQSLTTSARVLENAPQTKRILYNATENKILYAAWCQISNTKTGALTVVTKIQDVHPHTPEVLTQPAKKNVNENLRLVLSFDKEAIATEEETTFLIATTKHKSLKVMQISELTQADEYLVFSITSTSSTPYYNPKTLRTLKNITHQDLYCAAYETKKGKQASRIGSGVITLSAHQTRFVSFEDKGTDNDLCFCVSDDKDNLDEKLNREQLNDLSPILVSCSSKDRDAIDAVRKDQEFFIIPPIMENSHGSLANSIQRTYKIVGASEMARPLFLIDQLVKRFHALPELTSSSKADYDKQIQSGIKYHDANFTKEANEENKPRDLKETPLSDIEEEKDFVRRRREVIKRGLKKLFEKEINDKSFPGFPDIAIEDFDRDELVPTVAFVSTGGGYRAMVETVGFLEGAQEKNVLDCCMYMCGLSGSTWAINSLVASKQPNISKFADTFKKKVTMKTTQVTEEGTFARVVKKLADAGKLAEDNPYYGLFKLIFALSDSEGYKLCKYIQELYGQHQGFVGLYGHALVEALLNDAELNSKNSPHSIMLSDLRTGLTGSNPLYPLPISVCLHSPEDANSKDSQWVEFTPYTVGMYDMKKNYVLWHIPTNTFGSYYQENSLVHRIPEYPLGQLFGIFGSAMGISDATLDDYRKMRARSLLKMIEYMNSNRIGLTFDEKRMTAGVVPNFLYQGKQPIAKKKPKIFYEKNLRLVDGGMLSTQDELGTNCHNFATMPAVQRKCDVLILVDCSARSNEENNKKHLKAFYDIAAEQGFPLPDITDEQFEKMKTKSELLYDDELDTPSLIYILGQRHDAAVERFETDSSANKKTATAYFGYSEETYNGLHDVAKELFMAERNIRNIKKAILTSMSKKKKSLPASQSAGKSSKPSSAPPLPGDANNDADENDSSSEEKMKKSRNVDNDYDSDDKPLKKGSDKKKKKKKDSHDKRDGAISPRSVRQKSKVKSVDHDDSSGSDDNGKMTAYRAHKSKKSTRVRSAEASDKNKEVEKTSREKKQHADNNDDDGDSEDRRTEEGIASPLDVHHSTVSVVPSGISVNYSRPTDNIPFHTFKKTFPKPEESDLDFMKDKLSELLNGKPYEFFADFMNYAADGNVTDLVKFIMEKADASSNAPQENDLKKIYAIVKQEIMIVGLEKDIVYCSNNFNNPLHSAAMHSNTAMFKLLLYKNMFALGCSNEKKQTPLHVAMINKAQGCVDESLRFFEEIDSITIDNPRHTEMLKGLVKQIFTTKDAEQKTVADHTTDAGIKKRIRRILIKYYISSGL